MEDKKKEIELLKELIDKEIDDKLSRLNLVEVGALKIQSFDLSSEALTDLTIKTLSNPVVKDYLDTRKNNLMRAGHYG